ncbi:MAG: hypothetical protein A2X86_18115 [Bdellovibrionales bacterium GWA2_49_15]|nr:MAG: hypothetical protein A2X86_18115 [Bdellovibrionales bacterium GWA2_49_15]
MMECLSGIKINNMRNLIKFFLLVTIQSCVVVSVFSQEKVSWLTPKTQDFRKRIDFWKRIYSEIPSSEGILHDPNDLSVVYERINIEGMTHRQIQKKMRERKEYIRRVLNQFAKTGREGMSDEDFQLVQGIANRSAGELQAMGQEVRWQQGLSDRFKEGVQRSYLYLDKIREIFKEEDVPTELAFLPHVESSFNYRAYSKVGAAGIWQFMRSTARLFGLKANYILDERLDPIKAARSAARLLRNDYVRTGSWPLAITSYNHGVHGIVRAVNNMGNDDIEDMVKNYNGRRFGFASQNFFACFIAAYELASEPNKYFGDFEKAAPIQFFEINLQKSLRIKTILDLLKLDEETFLYYNRAIRPMASRYNYNIPANYQLKLPMELYQGRNEFLSRLEIKSEESPQISTDSFHIVDHGDSLFTISRFYHIPIDRLIEANGLLNPSSIHRGQKILLPTHEGILAKAAKKVQPVARVNVVVPREVVTEVVSEEVATIFPQTFDFYQPLPPLPAFLDLDLILEENVERTQLVMLAQNDVEVLPDDITKNYDFDLVKISHNVYQITIEIDETLGHYADWMGGGLSKIRALNGRKVIRGLTFGQKIELPITDEMVGDFNAKRFQYHQSIEEDFYQNYTVSGVQTYKVASGNSIESISREQEIPLWLIRKYRPDKQDLNLFKGQEIELPLIQPKG